MRVTIIADLPGRFMLQRQVQESTRTKLVWKGARGEYEPRFLVIPGIVLTYKKHRRVGSLLDKQIWINIIERITHLSHDFLVPCTVLNGGV